jgi:chromosome segregation ATPase
VLLIEHPVRQGYKVLNVKPVESTATMHRFEVKIPANGTEKFVVTEENLLEQGMMISSLNFEQIQMYVQNRSLSADGKKQLEAIAAQRRGIADVERQMRAGDQEIAELVKDQDRIRQNLSSLNQVTGQQEQVNKYARELADQEGKLAGIRDRVSQLRKQKATQEQQLNLLIEKASF